MDSFLKKLSASEAKWQSDAIYYDSMLSEYNELNNSKVSHSLSPEETVLIDRFMARGNIWTSDQYFDMRALGSTYIKKFKIYGMRWELVFKNLSNDDIFLEDRLESVFDRAIEYGQKHFRANKNDRLGFELMYDGLSKSILVPFSGISEISGRKVLRVIQRVLQSYENIDLGQPLIVKMVHVEAPQGGGRLFDRKNSRTNHMKLAAMTGNRTLMYTCSDDDLLCLPKAIVSAQYYFTNGPKMYKNWRRRKTVLRDTAWELLRECGITDSGPYGLAHVRIIQKKINRRIVIIQKGVVPNYGVIYVGDVPTATDDNVICIELFQNHYSWIRSLPSYYKAGYFCLTCRMPYSNRDRHICEATCPRCLMKSNCHGDTWRKCDHCLRSFPSDTCFDNHLTVTPPKKSTCQLLRLCSKCMFREHPNRPCYQVWCSVCRCYQPQSGHFCFVQPYKPELFADKVSGAVDWPPVTDKKVIFFDMETCPVGEERIHTAVYIVAQVCCDYCKVDWSPNVVCAKCAEPSQVKWCGLDALGQFCEWLFSKEHKNSIAFAHNGKGFDFQFIVRYLIDDGCLFEVIPRGLSLMQVTACGVRMLCSHNFLPFALKKLPSLFGFSDGKLVKGTFPHQVLTVENLNNNPIPWPSADKYEPDYMKPGERSQFLEWYNSVCGGEFRLLDELDRYCCTDVSILRVAIMLFRDLLRSTLYIDPFEKCATLPSACLLGFRHQFLKPKMMQSIPEKGFGGRRQQSQMAVRYLRWLAYKDKVYIRTAQSALGEMRIPGTGFYADGVVSDANGRLQKIYEIFGCYYHACIDHYPNCRKAVHHDDLTFEDVHQRTMARIAKIRECVGPDVEVVCLWEHDYIKEYTSNPVMRAYVDGLNVIEPLIARDAFRGGRCEPLHLLYFTEGSDSYIDYVDFCSLYPWVNKYCEYPVGACEIIESDFEVYIEGDRERLPYFGLVKAKLVPMERLLHPVLPYQSRTGRLLFPLCGQCAETLAAECNHSPDVRGWWGTYTTFEVNKALENGYVFCRYADGKPMIKEVWHWPNSTKYDVQTGDGGIFSGYVNKFLKLKTEASSWPPDVVSAEDKRKFLDDFHSHEGIELDPNNMVKNPSLRQVSKLMLCSLWGRLGLKARSSVKYVSSLADFYAILFDESIEVISVVPMNDDVIMVAYKERDEYHRHMADQAVVHSIFTSSYGRVKLYDSLSMVGDSCLYVDTDSLIYVCKKDGVRCQTGGFLGDLTREIGPSEIISEFCCSAAKSYSLKIVDTSNGCCRYDTKVKGFTLDYMSKLKLNHESMIDLVKEFKTNKISRKITTGRPGLVRHVDRYVRSRYLSKVFSVACGKRILCDDYSMKPFGYFNSDWSCV